jgi:hypothetical protein
MQVACESWEIGFRAFVGEASEWFSSFGVTQCETTLYSGCRCLVPSVQVFTSLEQLRAYVLDFTGPVSTTLSVRFLSPAGIHSCSVFFRDGLWIVDLDEIKSRRAKRVVHGELPPYPLFPSPFLAGLGVCSACGRDVHGFDDGGGWR